MLFWPTRRQLHRLIDLARVKAAIEAAERQTSGEIRVSVSPFFWGNVHRVAQQAFVRFGMHQTRERNGVLIFVVPARRRFTILGDEGIHAKVGQEFWDCVRDAMSGHFRHGHYTEGLLHGIEEAGRQLARHFPNAGAHDVNELKDDVDFGGELEE